MPIRAALAVEIAYLNRADPTALPPALGTPTPLARAGALTAPDTDLLSLVAALGATLAEGDPVVEITGPPTGSVTPVRAGTAGVCHARLAPRNAEAGKCLGTIAGTRPHHDGPLKSPRRTMAHAERHRQPQSPMA